MMHARRRLLSLSSEASPGKGLPKWPRDLRQGFMPASVSKTSSALERIHLGLLDCSGTENGYIVRTLFVDGALTSFVSTSLVKLLCTAHDRFTDAALVPNGTMYNLSSTSDPIVILQLRLS